MIVQTITIESAIEYVDTIHNNHATSATDFSLEAVKLRLSDGAAIPAKKNKALLDMNTLDVREAEIKFLARDDAQITLAADVMLAETKKLQGRLVTPENQHLFDRLNVLREHLGVSKLEGRSLALTAHGRERQVANSNRDVRRTVANRDIPRRTVTDRASRAQIQRDATRDAAAQARRNGNAPNDQVVVGSLIYRHPNDSDGVYHAVVSSIAGETLSCKFVDDSETEDNIMIGDVDLIMCASCQEPLVHLDSAKLACGHHHWACIECFNNIETCPLCREHIDIAAPQDAPVEENILALANININNEETIEQMED